MNDLLPTLSRIWLWIKEILGQDILDLFRRRHPKPPGEPIPQPLPPENIEKYRRQRLVLDWRDNCIFKVHDTASSAIIQFSKEIDELLNKLPTWKILIPDSASEVLEPYFFKHVKPLFVECLCDVINDANEMSFLNMRIKSELEEMENIISEMDLKNIKDIGFKPGNRERIINSISELVKGSSGALRVQKAALSLAEKMIN